MIFCEGYWIDHFLFSNPHFFNDSPKWSVIKWEIVKDNSSFVYVYRYVLFGKSIINLDQYGMSKWNWPIPAISSSDILNLWQMLPLNAVRDLTHALNTSVARCSPMKSLELWTFRPKNRIWKHFPTSRPILKIGQRYVAV